MRALSDALAHFGLTTKLAVDPSTIGGWIRRGLIGEPTRAMDELRNGRFFERGGIVHNYAWPDHANPVAKWYGRAPLILSATSLFPAIASDSGHRGASIGTALGRVAGSVVGAPFGQIGQLGGNIALGSLGGRIGQVFDKRPETPSAPPIGFSPQPTYTSIDFNEGPQGPPIGEPE